MVGVSYWRIQVKRRALIVAAALLASISSTQSILGLVAGMPMARAAYWPGLVASSLGQVPFTPLHVYYMAPSSCSDSNNGTSPSTPWCSPDHAVDCGDVIIAAAGSYPDFQSWGTVSNCPSTSGGIDGIGGVYFAVLLCGSASVGDCYITTRTNTSGNTLAMDIGTSNWAVEGWYINTGGYGRAIEGYACSGTLHHIAAINDISADNLQAMDGNDCGQTGGAGTYGLDYMAAVGYMAQNSAQDPICLGAIDAVSPGVYDTNSGTHIFFNTNYSFAHASTCNSDVEALLFDSFDNHDFAAQAVMSNNITYYATRMGIQVISDSYASGYSPNALIKIYNNTLFDDLQNTGTDNFDGDFQIATLNSASAISFSFDVFDNIVYQPNATSSGGKSIGAFVINDTVTGTYTFGGSGTQNILLADNASCPGGAVCDTTNSAAAFSPANSSPYLGTNTYSNPSFTDTSDLLANWLGTPNCSGFINTTACAGYNANTKTLTAHSIIADLVPTAGNISGDGFQLPSTTCAPNADYPTWLKGIVYLHWNGTSLTENADLVSKPCGY